MPQNDKPKLFRPGVGVHRGLRHGSWDAQQLRRILAAVFVFAGSVSHVSARTYAEKIERIPYPTDQADWRKKCTWLRWETARQQNIASSGTTQPGTFPYETQAIARNNVATLDSRMSDFHCNAGYVSSAPPPPAKSNIERCIEACVAKTHRTPEKCHDACDHR
jgi:hypothetical protein